MKRIIDNKSVELTDTEFKLYQNICSSYTHARFRGEDLFKGLFESDKEGYIIFLRPPSKTHSSLEVFLFLVTIMVHQQLRYSGDAVDGMLGELTQMKTELTQLVEENKSLLAELKEIRGDKSSLEKINA